MAADTDCDRLRHAGKHIRSRGVIEVESRVGLRDLKRQGGGLRGPFRPAPGDALPRRTRAPDAGRRRSPAAAPTRGRSAARRTVSGPRRNTGGEGDEGWRKLHLGVDGSSVIVACALTEPTADDAITGIRLVEVDGHLTRVTADPAYDTLAFYGAAGARGGELPQFPNGCDAVTERLNSPLRLSTRRYARARRALIVTVGASVHPSWSAAWWRVWPATMTPFGSITIGCCHPNRRRESATAVTAASEIFRGFFGYGRSRLTAALVPANKKKDSEIYRDIPRYAGI